MLLLLLLLWLFRETLLRLGGGLGQRCHDAVVVSSYPNQFFAFLSLMHAHTYNAQPDMIEIFLP
jgi:hypothetical protein